MNPLQQISDAVFRLGQVAPHSCSQCSSQNSLCIVSAFSNSCGLCLRSSQCCSFMLSSEPSWMSFDTSSSIKELRSDLRRTINVLSQISSSLDAMSRSSSPLTVHTLESCRGSKGSSQDREIIEGHLREIRGETVKPPKIKDLITFEPSKQKLRG